MKTTDAYVVHNNPTLNEITLSVAGFLITVSHESETVFIVVYDNESGSEERFVLGQEGSTMKV